MHTGKAAPLGSFVQQRASADCVIAATATVTGNSYEKIAAAFGIPVDPKNGKPDVAILDRGVDILDTLFPLFALGVLATPLIAKEDPRMVGIERQSKLASSEQIKSAIKGHKAVLGYHDDDDQVGRHALAWYGNQAIDCGNGEIVDINDMTIHSALVLASLK
jgi:hypothetical protein